VPVVAGVDSCPGGWLAVLVTFYEEVVDEKLVLLEGFEELSSVDPSPSFIAVDIPMGLLEAPVKGGRDCDREARKILGRPRSSSVFSPPVRPSLDCRTFEEARNYDLNLQSFGILPKVRELDRIMTPNLQSRIREVHPEISFFALAGLTPAQAGKKKAEGRDERIGLLEQYFFQVREGLGLFPASRATADDVLDAYACSWTAMRIFRGEAGCLPDDPPRDQKGLQMALWY
jgi:predicted RNase H-like nuclease